MPASGLLLPLSVRVGKDDRPVVRTVLSADEAAQSMTFTGDIPEGAYARLMKANFDRLIDGAASGLVSVPAGGLYFRPKISWIFRERASIRNGFWRKARAPLARTSFAMPLRL